MSDRDAAGSRRTLLPAVVGPAAAFVMWRDLSEWFEDKAQMFSSHPQTAEVARQLVLAAAQLQESGSQWQAARAAASEGGRSEVPIGADEPSSGHVLLDGRRLLGTGQVAEMLRVSPRRVVQMIDEGKLSATQVGGRWWIDPSESAVLMAQGQELG